MPAVPHRKGTGFDDSEDGKAAPAGRFTGCNDAPAGAHGAVRPPPLWSVPLDSGCVMEGQLPVSRGQFCAVLQLVGGLHAATYLALAARAHWSRENAGLVVVGRGDRARLAEELRLSPRQLREHLRALRRHELVKASSRRPREARAEVLELPLLRVELLARVAESRRVPGDLPPQERRNPAALVAESRRPEPPSARVGHTCAEDRARGVQGEYVVHQAASPQAAAAGSIQADADGQGGADGGKVEPTGPPESPDRSVLRAMAAAVTTSGNLTLHVDQVADVDLLRRCWARIDVRGGTPAHATAHARRWAQRQHSAPADNPRQALLGWFAAFDPVIDAVEATAAPRRVSEPVTAGSIAQRIGQAAISGQPPPPMRPIARPRGQPLPWGVTVPLHELDRSHDAR